MLKVAVTVKLPNHPSFTHHPYPLAIPHPPTYPNKSTKVRVSVLNWFLLKDTV